MAQVTRRGRVPGEGSIGGTQVVYPRLGRPPAVIVPAPPPLVAARFQPAVVVPHSGRSPGYDVVAPVSPALTATTALRDKRSRTPTPSTTIPFLPGERTLARRVKFGFVQACTLREPAAGYDRRISCHARRAVAALGLLACVVFDGLDGALARKFGVASPFGAQMDSLADLSSFGVATGRGLCLAGRWWPPAAARAPARWSRPAPRSGWPGSTSRQRTAGSSAACPPPWPPPCSPDLIDRPGGARPGRGRRRRPATRWPWSQLPLRQARSGVELPLWLWVVPVICVMITSGYVRGCLSAGTWSAARALAGAGAPPRARRRLRFAAHRGLSARRAARAAGRAVLLRPRGSCPAGDDGLAAEHAVAGATGGSAASAGR